MNIDDLQIVVLEDLKDHWDDPDVRALYADLMKMKFDGYGSVYGYGGGGGGGGGLSILCRW